MLLSAIRACVGHERQRDNFAIFLRPTEQICPDSAGPFHSFDPVGFAIFAIPQAARAIAPATPWQPHQLISGRAPTARTKILHTRGSSAPSWMGLVSRTADKGKLTPTTLEER